jgi:AraC-like DNA-binding protein
VDGEPSDQPDLQVFGPKTRYIVVRADPEDARPWLQQGPSCPLLSQHHIAHAGIMDARAPFEVRRTEQNGTFMLACLEGSGVVLADGKWKEVVAGQACLLPPFSQNSLKCVAGKRWKFAWVRFHESRESAPIISCNSPVSGGFETSPLQAAIVGLHAEASDSKIPSALHHWTELIHHYVIRFAQPHTPDSRLWKVWKKVQGNLRHPWTLDELAGIACMSTEHLRRTCRREIGRSPIQHLTFLRLQRASHLLAVTDDKIEIVAREVGFESPFTFSNTFKNWFGWRPSEHRHQKR